LNDARGIITRFSLGIGEDVKLFATIVAIKKGKSPMKIGRYYILLNYNNFRL